ncbi:hypothetical protein CJJ17_24975 [Gordonia polyisoprenivorans]|nr:hypothetical protein CJJ17_24975 [Gordonia polyisoprenivorans]
MLTGVRARAVDGTVETTAGASALERVASCSRMAVLEPAPSAGARTRRGAACPQSGQVIASGTAAIE